jgi:hypothetical protein
MPIIHLISAAGIASIQITPQHRGGIKPILLHHGHPSLPKIEPPHRSFSNPFWSPAADRYKAFCCPYRVLSNLAELQIHFTLPQIAYIFSKIYCSVKTREMITPQSPSLRDGNWCLHRSSILGFRPKLNIMWRTSRSTFPADMVV